MATSASARDATARRCGVTEIREEMFVDGFEDELLATCRPRGQDPCPPALLRW